MSTRKKMKASCCFFLSILLVLNHSVSACTILTCAKKGEVFAAGNEDDPMPFARVWFNPRTKSRYGSVCFGFADLQVQAAMNEYGLFFDFTAQYDIDFSKLHLAHPYNGDLFFEILGKCKTVPEALEYLKKYDFTASAQATISDASGRSVVINPAAKIEKQGDFQVNTNFNIINAEKGNYYCHRYDFAKQMLSGASSVSVPFLKTVLERTHQEGGLSTQYSYIFDQKRGIIHVYLFHDFEHSWVIDLKKELQKGYRMENLADHFPLSFAYETFIKQDPLYQKELILGEIVKKGLDNTVCHYLSAMDSLQGRDSALAVSMLEVALQLLKNAWNQHADGGMWEYWFSLPKGYNVEHFKDDRLNAADRIFLVLMNRKQFDIKLRHLIFEMYAYSSLVQGNTAVAKEYYEKCIAEPAETFPATYNRGKEMLGRLKYLKS